MTLNLADVQQWSPESVDDLAKAATARALMSRAKAQALPNLGVFESWDGASRDAAHEATVKMAGGLEMSAETAAKVAVGAGKIAPEVREIKNQLAALFHDAAAAPAVEIDVVTNSVIPPATTGWSDLDVARLQAKLTDLEFRISTILTASEAADAELAGVLNTAVGNGTQDTPGKFPKEIEAVSNELDGGSKQGLKDAKAAREDGTPKTPSELRRIARVEKAFTVLEKVGKLGGIASNISDVVDTYNEVKDDVVTKHKSIPQALVDHVPEAAGGMAGGAVGAETGMLAGAAIGTAIFPIGGTVIGGALGAMAGGFIGNEAGERAGKVITDGVQVFERDLESGKSILEATVDTASHVNDAIITLPQELVKDIGKQTLDLGKEVLDAAKEALD